MTEKDLDAFVKNIKDKEKWLKQGLKKELMN